jgi:hypothetical protein
LGAGKLQENLLAVADGLGKPVDFEVEEFLTWQLGSRGTG